MGVLRGTGGSGDTYATFARHELDADLAGGISLAVALIITSVVPLRSRL